ncbi:MAG: DNA topoisomerase III [Oscillospiraceae bacterium]|jgi:DNA topoisomerase-3|nr:DNA topoisomerase III [Oscillospiraceae bacterium]
MAKTLILTEKPSVARDIARVMGCRQSGPGCLLGGNYIVTWALGHLVTLADPETYDGKYQQWRLEDLPMLPKKMQLVVIKQTGKQFSAVSALLRRADVGEIVIATDAGREGELVARWILQKAGCQKPLRRLWISSQTDKAIREGFAALRPGKEYENLYRSAQARAEADWLVGLNITRALTCKHNAQLSAGRVQTPTLALIVRREEEILSFRPKEFYTVSAALEGFSALYIDGKNQSRCADRAQAEQIVREATGAAVVTELKREYRNTPPPPAYDLTELQREANRRFGFSAKQTLALTQSLYEIHKLVTYPRTDSRYIPEDVAATIPERLRAVSVGTYAETARSLLKGKISTRFLVNGAKVTDHHALLPTEESPNFAKLSREEGQIYDLIVRRFLAVLSPPHEYEDIRLLLRIGKHRFAARGKTVKVPGWKSVANLQETEDEENTGESELPGQRLPALRQGDSLPVRRCEVRTGKTKPPARYTEATLLTAMENPPDLPKNPAPSAYLNPPALGTPATRADIIEKLFDTFYIERRGRELWPTSKGKQVITIVPPDLRSAALTAQWEQRLAGIAKGQDRADQFLEEMRRYASSLVAAVIGSDAVFTHDNLSGERCPACGKQLLDVNGKKGRMLVCPDRDCGYRKSLSVLTNARCPECHKKLELRGEGEKRSFYCMCGFRERLSDFEKRRETAGANKRDTEHFLQQQKPEQRSTLGDLLKGMGEEK